MPYSTIAVSNTAFMVALAIVVVVSMTFVTLFWMMNYLKVRFSDMCWEWNWPRSTWGQGWDIILFFGELSISRRGDHSPRIFCMLIVAGIILLEFSWYNVHHEEMRDEGSLT